MLIIGKGTVFCRDLANRMITDGAVVCEGNEILEVGKFDELRLKYPQAELVDAKGKLIMPGLVNTHTHIYSVFSRGLALKNYDPKSFLDILKGLWWKIDETLTVQDSLMEARAFYLSCIKHGVTTVFDHHASYAEVGGSLTAMAEEARKFNLKLCTCYEISDRNGEAKMKEAVKENIDFARYAKKYPHQLAGLIGMHASFTLSEKTLSYIQEQNTDKVAYHVHVAEGSLDEEDCMKKYNMRIINRLHKYNMLGNKSICGHCIYINDEEMDLLKATDTAVAYNPESNMGNAVGAPPVYKMMKKGILVGLGTDGYTSDMLESLKCGHVLIKHREQDATVGFNEICQMLFSNNPLMAERYFQKPIGKLQNGAYADVIVVDYDVITPLDASNLNGHMLFGMYGDNVVTTVANGKVVMKDREILGMDIEKEIKEINAQAQDFFKRVNA